MTLKSLATGVAALTAVGAAAAGATSEAPVTQITPEVQSAVFGVPVRQEPAPEMPSADELIGVLSNLGDPGVPFTNKAGVIEGGIGPMEANVADKRLQKAAQRGQLPLSFDVDSIAPTGPSAATTEVTVSGPKLKPRTLNMNFVNQDGWKLSRPSAMALMQAAAEAD